MGEHTRRIRSYVIRAARMSDAQNEAYESLSTKYRLTEVVESFEWDSVFPECRKRIVEIGFGMGDATRQFAAAHPETAVLGVEVHKPGVGKLLWWIGKLGLENIRIVQHDAVEVFSTMIGPGTVDGIHIWFPDPWPKKRHHKRRLIQEPFVESVSRSLKTGGYIHAATDWQPYADHILDVFSRIPGLENEHSSWAPRPDYRPFTKFENKGLNAERQIRDIIFRKVD